MLPLRIAQIAPLLESVPPKFSNSCSGSVERAVAYLTDELVRVGHEVTLFAGADSRTLAKLVKCSPEGSFAEDLELERIYARASDFDILHFHIPPRHFPLQRRNRVPAVTTLYGRLDSPGLQTYFNEFAEMPVVALSETQRRPLIAKWMCTIPLGLPQNLFRPSSRSEGYLAFSSPITPQSRVDRAIEIARLSGKPIKIVSHLEPAYQSYFDQVAHLMQLPFVEFVHDSGESGTRNAILANSDALLMTADQSDPFAVNFVEALACGTPVIAFRNSSIEEVLTDGLSGFVVDSIASALSRIEQLDRISRSQCRKVFEARFTVARTAQSYVELFGREIASHRGRSESRVLPTPEDQLWS